MINILRPRTLILSPFAGDTHRNIQYARDCLLDSINRGEAPFASHLLYTQVLYDDNPEQRAVGFECEEAWMRDADKTVAYIDFGWSRGMLSTKNKWENIITWTRRHLRVEQRKLGGVWAEVRNA